MQPEFIIPDWPAPKNVHALSTTRIGGHSHPPYQGFNLGMRAGDDKAAVIANRALLRDRLPAEPCWLEQIHGTTLVDAGQRNPAQNIQADASFTRRVNIVCAVMTADCLPILLCNRAGTVAAAIHAGWRGLAAGAIESSLDILREPSTDMLVWLGPCIGPHAFEVGVDVFDAFVSHDVTAESAFSPSTTRSGKWFADLHALARLRLQACGITAIFSDDSCTYSDAGRFFSHRRENPTGRMASLIWFT